MATSSSWPSFLELGNDFMDLFLASLDPSDDLARFHPLKCPDLVELGLELGDEGFLILFVPRPSMRLRVLWCGSTFIWCFESIFEVLVGDVVIEVVLEEGGPQLLTKAVCGVSGGSVSTGCGGALLHFFSPI